ncbi:unnamed protein product [Trichobilharzia regenti]|uniref:CYCLIN domain-containing protein n=1 Tax=Trichobilharzia regenti TaxID=157069 RepID=A0A183W822_TRIRE|nr:unnamed protein product [Trichobilharzia regenti]VDQ04157.1 unnamed protein product [Trichobilharzia regenti]
MDISSGLGALIRAPETVPQAKYDPYFRQNPRVIEDLLFDEERYHTTPGYCIAQPRERKIWMRRCLFNWLRDISTDRATDGEVLAHATQLIDRYMHNFPTDRSEYQLVGATCFLIASKLKESIPISVRKMSEYTAHSLSEEHILNKELNICMSLMWDLNCITPLDFIAPVVEYFEFDPDLCQTIRKVAVRIFFKVFHVEQLGYYMPSYMAAACILYALDLTVRRDLPDVTIRSVIRIQQVLKLEASKIAEAYQVLQACFEPRTMQLTRAVLEGDLEPQNSPVRDVPVHLTHHLLPSIVTPVTAIVLLPVTNAVYMHSHSHQSSSDISSLSTSMVSVNNNVSFGRSCIQTASGSNSAYSTSPSPSEAGTN